MSHPCQRNQTTFKLILHLQCFKCTAFLLVVSFFCTIADSFPCCPYCHCYPTLTKPHMWLETDFGVLRLAPCDFWSNEATTTIWAKHTWEPIYCGNAKLGVMFYAIAVLSSVVQILEWGWHCITSLSSIPSEHARQNMMEIWKTNLVRKQTRHNDWNYDSSSQSSDILCIQQAGICFSHSPGWGLSVATEGRSSDGKDWKIISQL